MQERFEKVLTDIDSGIYVESLSLSSATFKFAGTRPWSIEKRRLHGGLSDGVDAIRVDNGALVFTLLPTRGMNFYRGEYKGVPIGWNSPVHGPVNPAFINLNEKDGFGWLKGMNETLTRCGLYSIGGPGKDEVTGETLTLHGRIANTPASYVKLELIGGENPELSVTGVVYESSFFGQNFRLVTRVSTVLGSDTITFHDEVTNLADTSQEHQLIYHCNFGAPFLGEGATVYAPVAKIVPKDAHAASDIANWNVYKAPTPGYAEQCNFCKLHADAKDNTLALLVSGDGAIGAAVRWNISQLPCFTQWKLTSGANDGYVTGLEPSTSFPNDKAFERRNGRVVVMPPTSTRTYDVSLQFLADRAAIASVQDEVKTLAAGRVPDVSGAPLEGWA